MMISDIDAPLTLENIIEFMRNIIFNQNSDGLQVKQYQAMLRNREDCKRSSFRTNIGV